MPSEGFLQTGASPQPADWGHTGRRSVIPIVWLTHSVQHHSCHRTNFHLFSDLGKWNLNDVINWQEQHANKGDKAWTTGVFLDKARLFASRYHHEYLSCCTRDQTFLFWAGKSGFILLNTTVDKYSQLNLFCVLVYFLCAFSSRRQWKVLGFGALQELGGSNGCILEVKREYLVSELDNGRPLNDLSEPG